MLDYYHPLKRVMYMLLFILGNFSRLLYLDFVLERFLVSCHELHVRPLALNIALQRQQFNQLRKLLKGIKTKNFHLTQDNDRLSAVGDTAEDLTWDSLAYVPIPRVNTYLQLNSIKMN